ncbi:MAG: transcription elongation factor GreA [Patescibacteria group bacterium]|nr:transcription elongation factor GreA [Patescibacteria group bacterium]
MKYITQSGKKKLEQELEDRKVKTRREIAEAIKEAKEQGDLSENAEYTEAKRQQRENESRIMQLENIVRTSEVVAHSGANNSVEIGNVVDIETDGKKMTFEIVGSNEADPLGGKISNESPIGKSFLGKEKGEGFQVELPNGKKVEYKILDIK